MTFFARLKKILMLDVPAARVRLYALPRRWALSVVLCTVGASLWGHKFFLSSPAALPPASPALGETPMRALSDAPALFTAATDSRGERGKTTIAPEASKGSATPLQFAAYNIRIQRKESLSKLLQRAGLTTQQISRATQALTKVLHTQDLKAGLEVSVKKYKGQFKELSLSPGFGVEVKLVAHQEGKLSAQKRQLKVQKQLVCVGGKVRSSLYNDAVRAGIPPAMVREMIKVLSHSVNFEDLQPNDVFAVMYTKLQDSAQREKFGHLTYVALTVSGQPVRIYGFPETPKSIEYFHEDGSGVHRALLRTPVDGAVMTSPFGMRRHPILKYTRFHQGVDFGAPVGARVMAAGSGVVTHAGWKGSYGNCVVIRHNNEYSTLYGHLKKLGPHTRRGVRIRQGDIIGYVGATGLCSGPHLHHEVWRFGKPINPAKVQHLNGNKLTGRKLRQFKSHMRTIDLQFAAQPSSSLVASLQKNHIA